MPLAQVTTIQLTAVRALLEHAVASATEGGPVGATVAMLVADVALETLLKQALADCGIEVPRHADVHDLTALLAKAKPALADCPEAQVARRMRGARNPVQHWGFTPSDASAGAHVHDAEAFAALVTREVYGVALRDISTATLVRDPDLRESLGHARDWLEDGRVDEACVHVAACFGLLFARCGSWIRPIIGITDVEERFTGGQIHPAVMTVFPSHDEGVTPNTEHRSWREITLLALGFPLPDLLSLKRIEERAEAVLHARIAGGEPAVPQPAIVEVRHAVDVLARQIWRIETAQPAIVAGSRKEPTSESEGRS